MRIEPQILIFGAVVAQEHMRVTVSAVVVESIQKVFFLSRYEAKRDIERDKVGNGSD